MAHRRIHSTRDCVLLFLFTTKFYSREKTPPFQKDEMAANIYVCRHGQDEDNAALLLNGHRDTPLTDLGRSQAAKVAETVPALGIDAIYASPLQRARVTAETIGARVGKSVTVWHELIERDFGVLTGKPLSDIPIHAKDKILKTEKVNYFLEVEGAETFPVLLERARKVLDKVHQTHPGETVLLVSHGDLGKMLMAAHRGMTWEEALMAPYIANTDVLLL